MGFLDDAQKLIDEHDEQVDARDREGRRPRRQARPAGSTPTRSTRPRTSPRRRPATATPPAEFPRALAVPRMTDRFRVVPAAYVFLLRPGPDGDEVLLQRRRNTGYMDDHWAAAAAGHVERARRRTTPRTARRWRRSASTGWCWSS